MKKIIFIWLLAAVSMASCGKQRVKTVIDGSALGTSYRVAVISDEQEDIEPALDSLFAVAVRSMSIFDSTSLLSALNANRTDSVDEFIVKCLEYARRISGESGGLFDITVKPLTKAYGFAGGVPTLDPNVDSIMLFVGYDKIKVENGRLLKQDPRTEIDLNAIAKGFTVDLVAQYLAGQGFTDYLVEIGGEVYASGLNSDGVPWKVSVDYPYEGNLTPGAASIGTVGLSGRGLATSGNYRRYYTDENGRKVVHTVNPTTGQPEINDMLSATVIAENATLADGYATMFMAMGVDRSLAFVADRPDLDILLAYTGQDGNLKIYMSEGLKGLIVR